MIRYFLPLVLFTTSLFAKEEMIAMSCGCPTYDYLDQDDSKRALPGPLNGVMTSMKCCPGIWAVSAAALAVGGVAYALTDSASSRHVHTHS